MDQSQIFKERLKKTEMELKLVVDKMRASYDSTDEFHYWAKEMYTLFVKEL